MTDDEQLHQDIALYLQAVDVARTDPLALQLGYGPPAMLEAYPCVTGIRAFRRMSARTPLGDRLARREGLE